MISSAGEQVSLNKVDIPEFDRLRAFVHTQAKV